MTRSAQWTLEAETTAPLAVRRWVWPSGLRVVVCLDRAAPIFSYQTWYRVGSRHERPGATGMAHLFEHLMFNQTANLAPGQFDHLIEETGGDTNAATWVDWTYYRDSLPSRDLELAVRLEADRMQNLTLEDEQLEAEREVVANERLERVEDDVDGFLDEQLFALAFTEHPYHWPTIGWMADIRAITRPQVHDFYKTFYAPNNATIVVCGDLGEDHLLELIERYYGDIAPTVLPADPAVVEAAPGAEKRATFAKPVHADRLVAGYRSPGQGHPDWPVLELIGGLLAGGPSARLYRELVIERELATTTHAEVSPFRDPGLFQVAVNLTRGHRAGDALEVLDRATARLRDEPVTGAELAKVKNCVETDFWSGLADADGKAEALGHFETTLDDFGRLFEVAARLEAVTAEDVQRVAREYLVPERRAVVIAEPDDEVTDS